VDPLAALIVAHGGTAGAVVEAAIAVGLVAIALAAWLAVRDDDEQDGR
jgi:hypothetical protein